MNDINAKMAYLFHLQCVKHKTKKEENYYRIERSYGAFHRDIPLPAEVETENIHAVFKNGVLSIQIPKKPEAQRKTKRIDIKTV